jgi:hypothetical protein
MKPTMLSSIARLSLLIVVAKPAQFNEQGGSTPENNGEPDHHNLPVAGKTFASLVPPHARIALIESRGLGVVALALGVVP